MDTQLVSDEVFTAIVEKFSVIDDSTYGICPDCKTAMEAADVEFFCKYCGLIKPRDIDNNKDNTETTNKNIKISTGSNRGKYYNTIDYAKTQRKAILSQLLELKKSYSGPDIPDEILREVVMRYNTIQGFTEDIIDADGKLRGKKKFVRRGSIKDEVLAALIYFECILRNDIRKKRDIAIFMKLPSHGFSRGEGILRELKARGKIELPEEEETAEGYARRYLKSLGIDTDEYVKFVCDIVDTSDDKNIGMNCQLSTKVAGAIWVLVSHAGLNISALAVEKATDNTKKSTFVKFSKLIMDNKEHFQHIFGKL